MLSQEALQLVAAVFSSKDLNFPASVASQVVEVREWAEKEASSRRAIGLVPPPVDAP